MTKHDWLCLFFDGVPGGPETSATNQQQAVAAATTNAAAAQVAQPKAVTRFLHAPYADNKCGSCHVMSFSQRIAKKTIDLCFACHTNFLATAKVKHAPVEQGECLACHNPHQADNKFLLVRKGKALCNECHDDVTLGKFKHAPAAEGACLDCHRAHVSDGPALLKLQGAALCYDCHDQSEVAKQTAHSKLGTKTCTGCHDPHSTNLKGLLKAAPGETNAATKAAAPQP